MAPALRDKRERVVREHMESEKRHDYEAALSTFAHPRYEIVPTGHAPTILGQLGLVPGA